MFGQSVTYRALDEQQYPAVCLGPHRIPQEADYSIAIQYPDRVVISCCWAERLSRVPSLSDTAYHLFKNHGVLITCFPFENGGKTAYRFYFTNVHDHYIHNPMVVAENGKKSFPFYYEYEKGLADMIAAAQEYIKPKPNEKAN
jgi:hypothetical protein